MITTTHIEYVRDDAFRYTVSIVRSPLFPETPRIYLPDEDCHDGNDGENEGLRLPEAEVEKILAEWSEKVGATFARSYDI